MSYWTSIFSEWCPWSLIFLLCQPGYSHGAWWRSWLRDRGNFSRGSWFNDRWISMQGSLSFSSVLCNKVLVCSTHWWCPPSYRSMFPVRLMMVNPTGTKQYPRTLASTGSSWGIHLSFCSGPWSSEGWYCWRSKRFESVEVNNTLCTSLYWH